MISWGQVSSSSGSDCICDCCCCCCCRRHVWKIAIAVTSAKSAQDTAVDIKPNTTSCNASIRDRRIRDGRWVFRRRMPSGFLSFDFWWCRWNVAGPYSIGGAGSVRAEGVVWCCEVHVELSSRIDRPSSRPFSALWSRGSVTCIGCFPRDKGCGGKKKEMKGGRCLLLLEIANGMEVVTFFLETRFCQMWTWPCQKWMSPIRSLVSHRLAS